MLRVIYQHVAGLDVHKKTVVTTRMRVTEDNRVDCETETFGTTTPDLFCFVQERVPNLLGEKVAGLRPPSSCSWGCACC